MTFRKRNTNVPDAIPPIDIAGRYGGNKYFSSNQALIYIGPYLLDEALAVSYKLEQRKIPIYGYASQYFDAVAAGKIIVTGALTINYVDSGYLYLAMVQSLKFGSKERSYDSVRAAVKGSSNIANQIAKTLGDINIGSDSHFDGRGAINTKAMRNVAQMITTNPVAGSQVIKLLRKKYWESASYNEDGSDDFQRNATASSFQNLGLDYDTLSDNSLLLRPDNMPAINITVSHGNPFQRGNSTYRVIRDLHIMTIEQNIGPTGQAQSETYHFIAKSIS